jgi:hypothetical protein
MFTCIYGLDCDPYPFSVADGLDPWAFEWSWCFKEDNREPDMVCPVSVHASPRPSTLTPLVVVTTFFCDIYQNSSIYRY